MPVQYILMTSVAIYYAFQKEVSSVFNFHFDYWRCFHQLLFINKENIDFNQT